MTIWFDMDGTIADLYGVNNWLNYIQKEDVTPYTIAKPLFNFSTFARMLHKLQKAGYMIGIVTWGSKYATDTYNNQVEQAKKQWLQKHLPSVRWDVISFMTYGTNKNAVNTGNDILFDDEKQNCDRWQGQAYPPHEIKKVLSSL